MDLEDGGDVVICILGGVVVIIVIGGMGFLLCGSGRFGVEDVDEEVAVFDADHGGCYIWWERGI